MPPYTIDQGPPKRFATHLWTPVGTSDPFLMNDRGYPVAVYPYVKVEDIGGWRALPEIIDNRAGKTAGPGEKPYPAATLGRTFSYKLEFRSQTEWDLDTILNSFLQSFSNQTDEGEMTVVPFDSSITWTYHARVIAFDPSDDWTVDRNRPFRYAQKGLLTLRLSDPYFYHDGVAYV